MLQSLTELEGGILLWIQNQLRSDLITPLMIFVTRLGDSGMIWILISLGLLIPKKLRKIGIMLLFSLGITFLIDNILLKNLVGRLRPYDTVYGLECLIERQKDFSFPSGHTGSSFAAAIVLLLAVPKRYGIPAMVLAFLIGFSRLYVGVHYLSDVLCGAAIGTVTAVIVYRTSRFLFPNRNEWHHELRNH